MTTAHICIMAAIIVYLGAMIFVGYLCSKNNNDSSDFYLGGRKLGPLVTAMSAEASDMSSWLLMGLPGLAYLTGIADAGWTAIGLAIGTYVNWRIVAKRIRRYTHVAGNSITLPSFFSNRYRDEKKILQSIGAIFIVIFFIPYTASGFAACGKLFASLFGVKYLPAMIISALVIVGYTTLGGFLAASTTDFIQSIIMSIALVIVFVFGISTAGGIEAVAGGYGAVLQYIDTKGQLHERELSRGYKKTTNNRMELMAAIVALETLNRPCQVDLYSDSKYLVDAFNQHWIDSWLKKNWKRGKNEDVKNVDLWKRLLKAKEQHQVSFHWVKGHADNPLNERCDQLATSAADGNDLFVDEGLNGLQK